ncbi:hypothetical protein Taro_038826 [Colocasia esculenta]|uniref:Uncharacterized protein n=1 Tax=Colocasia esculenta TaxID=4460 RepID=A0A843WGZ9_COLES|nr:hypothetical protein [Colocasia esculenta]
MRSERDARDDLIDTLRTQLAGAEAQLAEAREALDALRAVRTTVEHTDMASASTSRGAPDLEVSSLQEQLAAAVARAEAAELNELQSALSQATLASAEVTRLTQQLSELHSQVSQRDADLPCDAAELWITLSVERRECEREHVQWVEERGHERSRWTEECSHWEEECSRLSEESERLTQQAVEACASLGVSERLLWEAKEQYHRGREHAMREGQASTYSSSYLVTSSQYRRNVQEERAAQGSTGSHVSMRPPALRSTADPREAESNRQHGLAESGGEIKEFPYVGEGGGGWKAVRIPCVEGSGGPCVEGRGRSIMRPKRSDP